MVKNYSIKHVIQKNILTQLITHQSLRFRDLRQVGIDTNLFSYHLKLLVKHRYVKKIDSGYTLDKKGLAYVDRISEDKFNAQVQPKILTMAVIQNSNGDVLLMKRAKQPYIDTWTLPYGKLHLEDVTTQAAAARELEEKLQFSAKIPEHAGSCYIRVAGENGVIISSTLVHVFRLETDAIAEADEIHWARPHKLSNYDLAPAVEQIITRTFFRDPYFFEEFQVDW